MTRHPMALQELLKLKKEMEDHSILIPHHIILERIVGILVLLMFEVEDVVHE